MTDMFYPRETLVFHVELETGLGVTGLAKLTKIAEFLDRPRTETLVDDTKHSSAQFFGANIPDVRGISARGGVVALRITNLHQGTTLVT